MDDRQGVTAAHELALEAVLDRAVHIIGRLVLHSFGAKRLPREVRDQLLEELEEFIEEEEVDAAT